jgi:uncharacterized membrane protein YkoI
MRLTIRVIVVAIGTALLIAGGLSPDHPTQRSSNRGDAARAATVVSVQQPTDSEQRENERDGVDTPASGAAAERARQAAQAAVPGATAREVEREAGDDDNPGSAYEVELARSDGSTVEVDLDASFGVLATDRDDDRRNDSGNDD